MIIGSGASAVEAAELAVEKGANGITVLARHDKWYVLDFFISTDRNLLRFMLVEIGLFLEMSYSI